MIIISRFGVHDSVSQAIQRKANQFGQLTNSRNTFTSNQEHLPKHEIANLNSDMAHGNIHSDRSDDNKIPTSTTSGYSSQMSSCFSPLRNPNQYDTNLDPLIATGKTINYLKQESVMNSKSTGGNISSGMETSKMSVFSPVLSSTIMHASDRPERLSPIIAPPKFHDERIENEHQENVVTHVRESIDDQKSSPKFSIIEKV